jgi:hypothetical protein
MITCIELNCTFKRIPFGRLSLGTSLTHNLPGEFPNYFSGVLLRNG